jgi:hypothetical protein
MKKRRGAIYRYHRISRASATEEMATGIYVELCEAVVKMHGKEM